jgi:hypothetical protein
MDQKSNLAAKPNSDPDRIYNTEKLAAPTSTKSSGLTSWVSRRFFWMASKSSNSFYSETEGTEVLR